MKFITHFITYLFFLSTILSPWTLAWSQEKQLPKLTLGVIPFQGKGVKDYEAASLSERFHSELVKTSQFRVVETERVTEVLREKAYQQTGDVDNVAEVGKSLGAQWMVTGTVGRVGNTYTIDVRMIDVATRQVFLTADRDYSGPIDGLLNYIDGIANELALKTSDKLKTGGLEIECRPQGAFVYIDGELKGTTPFRLNSLRIGDHVVEIKKADYLDWKETVTIEPLKQKTIQARLKKLFQLKILSMPPYAKIYLSEAYLATTPWTGRLPEGSYKIKVEKDQYLTEEQIVVLNRDGQVYFKLTMKEAVPDNLADLRQDRAREKPAIKKGRKKWPWLLGSAVLLGGGLTAWLLLKGDKEENGDVIVRRRIRRGIIDCNKYSFKITNTKKLKYNWIQL